MKINLFEPEKTFWGKVVNIFAAYGVSMIWCVIIFSLYKELFATQQVSWFTTYKHIWWIGFIATCILAPLAEEVLFRFLPLNVAAQSGKKEILAATCIGSSVLFGMLHGGGLFAVPVQGVTGLITCWLFLKNNYSYWSAVVFHSLWNTVLYLEILKNIS